MTPQRVKRLPQFTQPGKDRARVCMHTISSTCIDLNSLLGAAAICLSDEAGRVPGLQQLTGQEGKEDHKQTTPRNTGTVLWLEGLG